MQLDEVVRLLTRELRTAMSSPEGIGLVILETEVVIAALDLLRRLQRPESNFN